MKSEELLNSLDHLGEDLLAEAEQTVVARRHRPWGGALAAAAVLALALGVGGFLVWRSLPGRSGPQSDPSPVSDPAATGEPIPTQTLPEYLLTVGDGSGLIFTEQFDDLAGQLQNDCWTGNDEILSLPVYRNEAAAEGDPYGLPHWYDEEQLQTLLNEAAARLGVSVTGETFYDYDAEDSQDQRPYSIHAATDFGELTVYGDGRVSLLFNNDHVIHARGEVEFDMPAGTTEEEARQAERAWAMSDCVAQLQPRLGLPECGVLPWSHWSELSSAYHAWTLYPRRNDPAQQLLSRCLEQVRLLTHDGRSVDGVELAWAPAPGTAAAQDCQTPDCLTLLGQYPILSLDAARGELAAGNYLLPAAEGELVRSPAKGDAWDAVELIYPTEAQTQTLMPYYRFWYAQEDNLYAAVYVPALRADCLTDWETALQAADPVETSDPTDPADPAAPLTEGCFTLMEDAARSYFTDGSTEVWMENWAVWVKDLTTDETSCLLALKPVEGTETELMGVTAQRLYFGWNYTGDWWGRNVYSVDWQGRSTAELGDGQAVRFQAGWLFLESFRTDVQAFALRIIDRNDRTVVDVRECWDYVLLDGSCYYIYAAGMQDPEALDALPEAERREALAHMRYDLCRLDPDGTVTVLGSLARDYYAAFFQFDPTHRQIRCYYGTEGGETLDLYTLRPVGEETTPEPTEETAPEPTEAPPDGYIPRTVRQRDGSWAIAGTWGEVLPAQLYEDETCRDQVYVDLDGDGFRELLYWCYGPEDNSVALCAYDLDGGLPVLLDSQVWTLTWNVRPSLEAEGGNVWFCLEGIIATSAPEPASDSLIMTVEKAALPVRLTEGKLTLDGADWLVGVTPLDPALDAEPVGIGSSFEAVRTQVKDLYGSLLLDHWEALVWAEPTDAWEGAAQTVYALVAQDGQTVSGLILYRKAERDSRWSFAAQGITPIFAPEDPASLEGLTVEQLTARLGQPLRPGQRLLHPLLVHHRRAAAAGLGRRHRGACGPRGIDRT